MSYDSTEILLFNEQLELRVSPPMEVIPSARRLDCTGGVDVG